MSTKSSEEQQLNSMASSTMIFHGDLLQEILARLPTVDHVSSSFVSTAWREAIFAFLNSTSNQPWLILHVHNSLTAATATHAFDPHGNSWVPIPPSPHVALPEAAIRSSTSSPMLYKLTPSKLAFSVDVLNRNWIEVDAPRVWRRDPVVAVVGDYLVVAGGVCEFEDDPCSVEATKLPWCDGGSRWESLASMPEEFRCSSSSTWLSTAVEEEKFYVIEKSNGLLTSFDPKVNEWKRPVDFGQTPGFYHFAIASLGREKLILMGIAGDPTVIPSLWLWEVDCETMKKTEIGRMPPEMVARLVGDDGVVNTSSIEVRTAVGMGRVYVYNSVDPKEIFFCKVSSDNWRWCSVRNPATVDRNPMDKFLFTCSLVDFHQLRRVLGPFVGTNK